MLINLRNALMAGKRLPYDAEVEYLQSSGTQYINTGIKPGPNTRVEITFAMTTFTANCGLFGARGNATADNNSYNLFIISNSGARVRWDWSGSGQYQTSEAETSTDATYDLGAAGGNITRNGTTVMSVSASKAAINYPLYVFNFNNVGTPYSTGANARFWSVKIYEGQTLVFDAIPVRKGAVGYLYDRVSGKLFGNAGTGDFICGPDVVPVEYIESHGTEYIDTGVKGRDGYDFEYRFRPIGPLPLGIGGEYESNQSCYIGLVRSNGYLAYNYSNPNVIAEVQSLTLGTDYNVKAHLYSGKQYFEVNGVRGGVGSRTGTFTSSYNLYLFAINSANQPTNFGVMRLYGLTARLNTVPARSFLPVRVGTGSTWEGAMMDVLTRRIYRNAGTGAFTYGNDLKYPIPAE